jgi:hypothetical protein
LKLAVRLLLPAPSGGVMSDRNLNCRKSLR